tara:strand:+ start:725 stop:1081 length:357 start_codon:yes stop_codon:yes gene_type:complete
MNYRKSIVVCCLLLIFVNSCGVKLLFQQESTPELHSWYQVDQEQRLYGILPGCELGRSIYFSISQYPMKGEFSLIDYTNGYFSYTPIMGRVGYDYIVYDIFDGRNHQIKKIKFNIKKK